MPEEASGALGDTVNFLLADSAAAVDELLGREARQLFEDAIEVRQIAESGLGRGEEDVVGLKHNPLGVLDAALGEVLRDGLPGAV